MNRKISDNNLQLDALDGLRGLAALIVILSHTSNASMFFAPYINARGIGKSGVFLFFLLSSFLLSRALMKKGDSAFSMSSMSSYGQRRFFRIYPLYTLYLLVGLISTSINSLMLNQEGVGVPFSLTVIEFLNHLLLVEGKGVTWSIAVEFKFYFILPFLIFFTQFVKAKSGFIMEITFLFSLVVVTQIISPQSESLTNDSRLMPYMCIFILGTILAAIQCEIESGRINREFIKPIVPLSYLSLLALVFMTPTGASLILDDVKGNLFHKNFIQYTVFWSIILLSVVNFNSKLSSLFKMKWLSFYGALSFSIYLFHPVFIGIAKRMMLGEYISAWFVIFSSTLISYISYRFLELPVSKLKFTYNKSKHTDAA